jgi:hypothetical protein
MSERKGHGNRGSLMELAKPRLAQSPLSTPIDEAERLILADKQAQAPPLAHSEEEPVASAVEQVENSIEVEVPSKKPGKSVQTTGIRVQQRERKSVGDTEEEDLVARLRKARGPSAVVGFKLPASLKDELSAVAQYNGTDMTRIVVEALHRLLPELPHPPNWKQ